MVPRRSRVPSLRFLVTVCLLAVLAAGCGYVGYYARSAHWKTTFDLIPTQEALNKFAPENSLVVAGTIARKQKQREPLLLVAVSSAFRKNEKVALVQVPASAAGYLIFLPKGEYELFLFADLDRNRDFESDELVGRVRAAADPALARGGMVVAGPEIACDLDHPSTAEFRLSETVRPSSYVYSSLDDVFFDPSRGTEGLYNPAEFVSHTQGFLFGLEDYDPAKTTVLFVHGFAGTPRDWKFLAAGLDRSRVQPFFFYYPSGLQIQKLGALLAQVIDTIDRSSGPGRSIVVAAHSMGGLVALSALRQLRDRPEGFPASIRLFCTLSTPFGGDEAARKGVDVAPIVLPVWRDIASDSAFLRELTDRPLPERLPYYLFFSYNDTSRFKLGETSDGAVTLRSQLVPALQAPAARVLGFNETHSSILQSPAVRASFLELIEAVSPPAVAVSKGLRGKAF